MRLWAGLPECTLRAIRLLCRKIFWREKSDDPLELESRFYADEGRELAERGHDVEIIGAFDETVGHARMIIRHADGIFEGGADPRSDGAVAAYQVKVKLTAA